jgi:hypothetical protein
MGKKNKHHRGSGHHEGFSEKTQAQMAHNTIGSGAYNEVHHNMVNYGIPDPAIKHSTNHDSGNHKDKHLGGAALHDPLMGGHGGHKEERHHDRMIVPHTRLCGKVYKNTILWNLKPVLRFHFYFNVSFISLTAIVCLMLWAFNPEEKLAEGAEVCFDVDNCNNDVHCWDNAHIDSVVFAPDGYYPTESMCVS